MKTRDMYLLVNVLLLNLEKTARPHNNVSKHPLSIPSLDHQKTARTSIHVSSSLFIFTMIVS